MIQIVYPLEGAHDRDGDGLVDIELTFKDTGSGIDTETLAIESDRPLGPSGTGGRDLISAFNVVERDSLHIVLEETTEALLPHGSVLIEIGLSDRAGNQAETRIQLDMEAGAFHEHMPSPITGLAPGGIEIAPTGPSGEPIGVLLSFSELIPFDPRTLNYGDPIPTGGVLDPVNGEWDPVTQRLFLVSAFQGDVIVFDPVTMELEPPIRIFARSIGISRAPSGLLYIACSTTPATFSVVDPRERREIRFVQLPVIDPLDPNEPAFIKTPQVPVQEDRLYIPLNVFPGGLLVVDPLSGTVLRSLDVYPTGPLGGIAVESVLDRSRGLLFISELLEPGGLTVLDITTETIVSRVIRSSFAGKFPALSPSGDRIFLTLGRNVHGVAENWIIDTNSFQILARFPETHSGFTGANKVVFRPDGQLVFVTTAEGISVYLNRE